MWLGSRLLKFLSRASEDFLLDAGAAAELRLVDVNDEGEEGGHSPRVLN